MAFTQRRKTSRRFETLESRCLLAADVFISEFAASNGDGLRDEDGDNPDWIEIFNAGPDDAELGGWHLTDNAENLTKWSFPDQVLPGGSYLVVFASGKERAEVGKPLHTNFRLSAGGEYLALTQDGRGDAIDVVSEFAPEYPQQLADASFGVTQTAEITNFIQHDDAAKILVPSSRPSSSWRNVSFDDSDWLPGTAAVGYQTAVPGFTVLHANSSRRLDNLADADDVLEGIAQISQTTAVTPVVNFLDTGGSGNFGNDLAFPNDGPGDDDNFAIRATGTITIPDSGRWTFGINSDDGARLRINGQAVITDDRLHAPEDNFGSIQLSAGEHEVELTFFELGGGAEVELFAAEGRFTSFNSDFRLVGDVANGGLEVKTAAQGGETAFGGLVQTDLLDVMQGNASTAYLRIPFEVERRSDVDALTVRVNYNDGFVAYLNGIEVATRNAPNTVNYNSTAEEVRSGAASLVAEEINLTPFLARLNSGTNVLAIHGVNDDADSDNFLIAAELTEVLVESDKEEFVYFSEPTPGAVNASTGAAEFLANDITFSQPHGFYDRQFNVTIATEQDNVSIRYTLDGSEPTETNGLDYSRSLRVDATTTLRARLFKENALPSHSESVTYIFLDDVVDQSPAGQPPEGFPSETNINGQQLDYGMDPAIVNSSRYRALMDDALLAVPTMSLVMDVDDLLDPEIGIYTNARSHGQEWERPASLELIQPDGSAGFQVNAGVRIRGGFSRSGNNPKHAFRLFFRGEYGDAELDFPLFGDEGTDKFQKMDLRTTQNYSWAFGGDDRNTFLRDIFSRDVQGQMGQEYTRGRYYHLYINGQYWGLFQTEERPEANFGASYFGGSAEDYDVVKSAGSSGGYANEATDGTLDAYQRLADYFYQTNGLSDRNLDDYFKAQGMNPDGTPNPEYERLLDVDNLIDYMVITYYTSDADGPGSKFTRPRVNNYFGIFNREEPDGFKFFEHDSEHSLDTGNAAGANYNMVLPLTTGGAEFRYFNPHWMHEQLAETNSEYRQRFGDAVYRHLFNDGPLTEEAALRTLDARASQINVAMIAESARWGDAKQTSPLTLQDWENAVDDVRDWISERLPVIVDQLDDQGWYNEDTPPEFRVNGQDQFGGKLDGELDIRSSSTGRVIYYTLDGSDPRAIGGDISDTAIAHDGNPFPLERTATVSTRWLRNGVWSSLSRATFEVDSLVGDIDLDGAVGFSDFLILSANFGNSPADASQGDLDGDKSVGFSDFLLLSANFGAKQEAAALVVQESSLANDWVFAAVAEHDEFVGPLAFDWSNDEI